MVNKTLQWLLGPIEICLDRKSGSDHIPDVMWHGHSIKGVFLLQCPDQVDRSITVSQRGWTNDHGNHSGGRGGRKLNARLWEGNNLGGYKKWILQLGEPVSLLYLQILYDATDEKSMLKSQSRETKGMLFNNWGLIVVLILIDEDFVFSLCSKYIDHKVCAKNVDGHF